MYSLHNDLMLSHYYATDEYLLESGRQPGRFNLRALLAETRQMQKSMFDARDEIDYMGVWPKLQEFNRLVYMPIDDCPVSDMTEFYKYGITKGKGCIITNQGNIMVYTVPGTKKPPEITHRLVRAIIPKAIKFYLNGHLLRRIADTDRTTLGYFNRFKF